MSNEHSTHQEEGASVSVHAVETEVAETPAAPSKMTMDEVARAGRTKVRLELLPPDCMVTAAQVEQYVEERFAQFVAELADEEAALNEELRNLTAETPAVAVADLTENAAPDADAPDADAPDADAPATETADVPEAPVPDAPVTEVADEDETTEPAARVVDGRTD